MQSAAVPELEPLQPQAPGLEEEQRNRRTHKRIAIVGGVCFAVLLGYSSLRHGGPAGGGGEAEVAARASLEEKSLGLFTGLRAQYDLSAKVPIFTVNTVVPNVSYPMPGSAGRSFVNLGVNRTWQSWRWRATVYSEGLRKLLGDDPDRLVILADGSDVMSGGCTDAELLASYHDTVAASGGAKVVYGAQSRQYPPLPPSLDRKYAALAGRARAVQEASGLGPEPFVRYLNKSAFAQFPWDHIRPHNDQLNAGLVMGPAGMLADVYGELAKMSGKHVMRAHQFNDQKALHLYMFGHSANVTLDYGAGMVLNLVHMLPFAGYLELRGGKLHNTVTGGTQCFVHGNGDGFQNWQKLVSQLSQSAAQQ